MNRQLCQTRLSLSLSLSREILTAVVDRCNVVVLQEDDAIGMLNDGRSVGRKEVLHLLVLGKRSELRRRRRPVNLAANDGRRRQSTSGSGGAARMICARERSAGAAEADSESVQSNTSGTRRQRVWGGTWWAKSERTLHVSVKQDSHSDMIATASAAAAAAERAVPFDPKMIGMWSETRFDLVLMPTSSGLPLRVATS